MEPVFLLGSVWTGNAHRILPSGLAQGGVHGKGWGEMGSFIVLLDASNCRHPDEGQDPVSNSAGIQLALYSVTSEV
jgi:hypothetical protein